MVTHTFDVDAVGAAEPYEVLSGSCRTIIVFPQHQDSGVNHTITGNASSSAVGRAADREFVIKREGHEPPFLRGDRPFSIAMESGGTVTWVGIEY